MALLTIEYKVVTVPYFLDEMQYYEIAILMDKANVSVKSDWMIAREIMWSNMSVWSKKKIKPSDIMKFDWDNKNDKMNTPKVEVNEQLKEKMMKQAEARKAAMVESGIL